MLSDRQINVYSIVAEAVSARMACIVAADDLDERDLEDAGDCAQNAPPGEEQDDALVEAAAVALMRLERRWAAIDGLDSARSALLSMLAGRISSEMDRRTGRSAPQLVAAVHRIAGRRVPPCVAPIYDEVYAEGAKAIDALAGPAVPHHTTYRTTPHRCARGCGRVVLAEGRTCGPFMSGRCEGAKR